MSLLAGQVPCWSATSPEKEREKRWTRGPELHRRGTVLRTAGWLLSHRAPENYTAAQVTRRRKTSPAAVLKDRGLRDWWSRRDSHPHRAD